MLGESESMCDSEITVSCLSDFTSYCPADSLCSADIRPHKKIRPRSKVKSRVVWFTRKASYPSRQGISSQLRIKPLGETKCADEQHLQSRHRDSDSLDEEAQCPSCSSDSSSPDEEEIAGVQNDTWLHEQPPCYVSREELDALKGCVTRGRALFSPRPSNRMLQNPFHLEQDATSSDDSHSSSHALTTSPFALSGSSDRYMRESELHVPPVALLRQSDSHDRQGSFEYDHLEDFDAQDNTAVSENSGQPVAQSDACSVSIQFGATGYECQAVCEAECSNGDHISCSPAISITRQGREVIPPLTPTITRSCSTVNDYLVNSDGRAACGAAGKGTSKYLLPSHSYPERLNSPSLTFGRDRSSTSRSTFQRRMNVVEPALARARHQNRSPVIPKYHMEEQACKCNSWPRNSTCDTNRCTTNCSDHSRAQEYPAQPSQQPQHRPISPSSDNDVEEAGRSTPPCLQERGNKDVADMGSTFSLRSLQSHLSESVASSCCECPHIPYVKGVDGSVFKDRMELLTSWFAEFNDQQRNMMLLRLLEDCNCAQMHLLSVHMEPILHHGCPHNCQDLLSWLPPNVTFHVLSFLDPVSLCHASQVNHSWYYMTSDPKLWKALCKASKWQLSPPGEIKHLKMFSLPDGKIQWKQMFSERFRLRRNWLNGYCNVRTFEGHTQGISCIQFDDTRIVSGSWDKTIKVWNRRTNTAWAALTLAGHSGTVRCLHLHGNRLVSGSSDRTLKVWDLSTDHVGWVGATCRATMVGHMHTVRCLQADDNKVISGSYDLTLKVWDIKTGQCKLTLQGHTDAVLCLQFDDEKVVSGSKDTTIKVWSLTTGQCKLTLHGHQGAVTCLQFDETRIISGALDRLIKIWNINSGQCIRSIDWIRSEGHTGVVRYLQADRWKIVSGADDKTLKVWSVHTGDRLLTLKSHADGVTCLQFNDEVIVSGSYDKTVKLWDFSAC